MTDYCDMPRGVMGTIGYLVAATAGIKSVMRQYYPMAYRVQPCCSAPGVKAWMA